MDLIGFFQQHPVWFCTVVFLFSLTIGSFLNVVIYRLPIMMEREWRAHCAELIEGAPEPESERFDLMMPPSSCPACHTRIRPLHNIPVVSFLLLKGRCATCDAPISFRYPVIEMTTALLSAVVAWRFGFGWATAPALVLTWSLLALSVIDIDHQLLPDSITVPLVWIGLGLSLFHTRLGGGVLFVEPRTAIVGALAGYLSLWGVYWLFKLLTGKEGMGHGDFKLLAALGAWLGWQMLPLIVILSTLLGAVIGVTLILLRRHGRGVPIPFGPYLAAAGWVAMLWGSEIIELYFSLSGIT